MSPYRYGAGVFRIKGIAHYTQRLTVLSGTSIINGTADIRQAATTQNMGRYCVMVLRTVEEAEWLKTSFMITRQEKK